MSSDAGSIPTDDTRSARMLIDDFNNPSALLQGTQVADNESMQSDIAPSGNGYSVKYSLGPLLKSHGGIFWKS